MAYAEKKRSSDTAIEFTEQDTALADRTIGWKGDAQLTANSGVCEPFPPPIGSAVPPPAAPKPAHTFNGVVADLNERWRVINRPLYWELQRRKGTQRIRNSGWKGRSFCTTKGGLLCRVREYCGEIAAEAALALAQLPELHRMQNLDVPEMSHGR